MLIQYIAKGNVMQDVGTVLFAFLSLAIYVELQLMKGKHVIDILHNALIDQDTLL